MPTKLSDDELLSLLERERNSARDFITGEVGFQRRLAYEYYYGKPFGNEEQGRSQIVSQLVAEVIDSALPDIIETFAGSEDAVQCEPRNEGDTEAAEQATDVCRYVFWTQNNGFLLLYEGIKDALLQKTGVWKYYWDKEPKVVTESYNGQTIDQLTMLREDPEVEIIGADPIPDPAAPPGPPQGPMGAPGMADASMPQAGGMPAPMPGAAMQGPPGMPGSGGGVPAPMLYNVTVRRKKEVGKVCIECVAPEELYVSNRARTVDAQQIPYIGIRRRKTLSELIEMGYPAEQVMDLRSGTMGEDWSEERLARTQRTGNTEFAGEDNTDSANPMMREVWYNEEYPLVDYDGDGVAERRVCCSVGGTLLHNETIERVPIAIITPKIMPHEFFGISLADDCMDLQLLKSTLWRQSLDNIYLTNTPRTIVLDGQANIDDVLTPTPGGVLREYTPNAIRPFEVPFTAAQSFQMIEFLEQETQGRTGVDRYGNAPSLNPDSLNKTLGGANIALQKSQARMKLICRSFAETGIKQIFQGILWLMSKYQDKAMTLRVRNKWVNVDPRAWQTEYDFSINVGLGTGSKDQQMQHMMMFGQVLMQAGQMGCVTPKNAFNYAADYGKLLGFKETKKYVTDPTAPDDPANPKPPPQPDPMMQVEQVKQQGAQQLKQMDLQAKGMELQHKDALDERAAQRELALQASNDQRQAALDQQKMALEVRKMEMEFALKQWEKQQDVALEQWKTEYMAGHAAQLETTKLGYDAQKTDKLAAQKQEGESKANAPILEQLKALADATNAPKRVVRGPDGRVAGVESGGRVRKVTRDQNGRVEGLQ